MPFDQSRIIEQAKFRYSPLGKTFEKQTKTIEEQGKKQIMSFVNERKFEINKSSEEINFNNLTYYYTENSAPKYFIRFKSQLIMHNDMKNDRISLQKEEKIQE